MNGTMAQILEYAAGANVFASVEMHSGTTTAPYNNTTKTFTVTSSGGTVRRSKLEMGSISTLTNDPPQDYGVELAKCQRYQASLSGPATNRIRNSYISSGNIDFPIPVSQTLRTAPTIVYITGELQIVSGKGNTTPIEEFTFSALSKSDGFIVIRATKSAHGLTEALLYKSSNSDIILFDANL